MRRVLIVDDEEDARALLSRLVAYAGCEPFEVASGEEALGRWEEIAPNCVLVDLKLPGLSGWDVLSAIQSRGLAGRVIVIAITSFYDRDVELGVIEAGFDGFLEKPVQVGRLFELIKETER